MAEQRSRPSVEMMHMNVGHDEHRTSRAPAMTERVTDAARGCLPETIFGQDIGG